MRSIVFAVASAALATLTPALAQDEVEADAVATEATAETSSADEPMELHVRYFGYFWGMRIMVAEVTTQISGDAYVNTGAFRTAGFANWVRDTRLEAGGSGVRDENGAFVPSDYWHQGYDGRKNRRIEMDYGNEDIDIMVDPPFGDWGDPPATPEQRLEAFDPLSTLVEIAMSGGEEPCNRSVPVFDSRLRYNLRFEFIEMDEVRIRGYRGPAYHCRIYYEPVAGFDPDDLEESADAYEIPIDAWLAADLPGGVTPPLILEAQYGMVRMRVEAKRVHFQPADAESAAALDDVEARD